MSWPLGLPYKRRNDDRQIWKTKPGCCESRTTSMPPRVFVQDRGSFATPTRGTIRLAGVVQSTTGAKFTLTSRSFHQRKKVAMMLFFEVHNWHDYVASFVKNVMHISIRLALIATRKCYLITLKQQFTKALHFMGMIGQKYFKSFIIQK